MKIGLNIRCIPWPSITLDLSPTNPLFSTWLSPSSQITVVNCHWSICLGFSHFVSSSCHCGVTWEWMLDYLIRSFVVAKLMVANSMSKKKKLISYSFSISIFGRAISNLIRHNFVGWLIPHSSFLNLNWLKLWTSLIPTIIWFLFFVFLFFLFGIIQ